jgi:hypothetical protein
MSLKSAQALLACGVNDLSHGDVRFAWPAALWHSGDL